MEPGSCVSSTASSGLLGRSGRRILWSEFKILSQFYLVEVGGCGGVVLCHKDSRQPLRVLPGRALKAVSLELFRFPCKGTGVLGFLQEMAKPHKSLRLVLESTWRLEPVARAGGSPLCGRLSYLYVLRPLTVPFQHSNQMAP